MPPDAERVSPLWRLLGASLVAVGLFPFGLGVAYAVVWIERPWQLIVPAGLGVMGGLGLAWGTLLYVGRSSARHLAGTASLITALVSGLVMFWVTGLAQHQIKGWPGWPFHLGLIAGIVGLVVFAVLHQLSWNERVAKGLAGYRPASVALLRPGETARVRGEVREPGLTAPVSGKPCAAWSAEVLGLVSRNWIVLGSVQSGARFVLGADEGSLRVEADRALFARGSSQEQLTVSQLPEVLRAAAQDHGFFRDRTQFSVRELRIDVAARVSVLGTVRPDGAMGERPKGELLIELERA